MPSISISHCSKLVACAVGTPARLGLDIESAGRRKTDFARLAESVFHPLELAALSSHTGPSLEHFFLARWTLKEALAKALGVGLTLPMRQYAFVDDTLAETPADFDPGGWHFARPPFRPDIYLALAWQGAAVPNITLHPVPVARLLED